MPDSADPPIGGEIQWSPSITGGWQTVVGPLGVNSWTFVPDGSRTSGFYRVSGA
jgi:hypothetical protein